MGNATFYLLFPPNCSDGLDGYMTYNDTADYPQQRCGPAIPDHVPQEVVCGRFEFPTGRVFEAGQTFTGRVSIAVGPSPTSTPRFVFIDGEGQLAESFGTTVQVLVPARYAAEVPPTNITRSTSGQVMLEVYADGGRCQGVLVGGGTDSHIALLASG